MTTVTPPANVNYGTVTGRFIVDVVDSPDVGADPDFVTPTGTVTFIASVGKLLDPTASPDALTILRYPITGVLNDQGYLCTPLADGSAGAQGVKLIATDDADLNPTGWVWNVTYALTGPNGSTLSSPAAHTMALPTNATIDLTTVIPPDDEQAIGIPQAQALAAQAAASAAEAAAALADIDPTVSTLITDGVSDTALVVTALLAPKVDTTSVGREALKLVDYSKRRSWYAALARRRDDRVNVGILGASLAEGYPVTSPDRTVSSYVSDLLNARMPTKGLTTKGRGFMGIPHSVMPAGSHPFTFTGGTLDDGAAGHGAKKQCWYASATGKLLLALAAPVTSFDICHVLNTSGNAAGAYYKIDGGSSTTFNTLAGSTTIETKHIPLPANTSIEVGWAAGLTIQTGIHEYAGDEAKGIQVHNLGHSGFTAANWAANSAGWTWLAAIAALNLDLIVIQDLGINDGNTSGANVTAATCKTNILAFIALLRANSINAPIELVASQDVSYATTFRDPWSAYVTAMKEIAASDATVEFFDHGARMPATAATDPQGLYHTDHVHGAANGSAYLFMAETIAAAIAPR